MTLGEKIYALRRAARMSQGDLAEKLNVSRQSISKWETNASTPELEKLVAISDLFGITLDELVRCDDPKPEEVTPPAPAEQEIRQPHVVIHRRESSIQKSVGLVLLAVGLLCCVLALFVGGGLLIPGAYMVLCSVLCLVMRRGAALVIGWMTFLLWVILAPYVTGYGSLWLVFHPGFYEGVFSVPKAVVFVMWGILFLLLYATVRTFKQKKK